MKPRRILMSALTALIIGWLSAAEAQPIPSSAVVCYLVGRIYFDNKGNAEVAGYFTDINGIGASDSLFNGTPSESTAFFTFHTTVSISSLPGNGDITPLLGSAGLYDIYYNPAPKGDWSNPSLLPVSTDRTFQPAGVCLHSSTLSVSPNIQSQKPCYLAEILSSEDISTILKSLLPAISR
jgi:hypothetical protein